MGTWPIRYNSGICTNVSKVYNRALSKYSGLNLGFFGDVYRLGRRVDEIFLGSAPEIRKFGNPENVCYMNVYEEKVELAIVFCC